MNNTRSKANQNIQVYVRVRPTNDRERNIRSIEMVDVPSQREVVTRNQSDPKMLKKFTFDKAFGPLSTQCDVYQSVVAPLTEEVLAGYNCTVFAYGQTGTGKTHTMIGEEAPTFRTSWDEQSNVGIIPRAVSHLFDELRLMEVEFSMRISYLELYNEDLFDLLSAPTVSGDFPQIRIFDDATKKGSIIVQGLEEIPVHSTADVYKLLAKGQEKRRTASTLMNAQSSRSHTIFSILVHIKENGLDGEELLKIGKLNLVDLAGSENISKSGNERGIRIRETVNINQSLLTLGRVITALVERTPHIPYRESKLTRLLQESLGGRTKTSIIATVSPGHKDMEETLSTLEYAHRAKNIQNKPEINQKLTKKTVLKEYTEEIDRLKRDLMSARGRDGFYVTHDTYNEMQYRLESQNSELNEKMQLIKALKDELGSKQRLFSEISLNLVERTEELKSTQTNLECTKHELGQTKRVLKTTQKRYKEKNYLLSEHVRTETKLTEQANELISVVDKASVDTYRLHDTIDRRKTVDDEIKGVCSSFESKMEGQLDKLNDNVMNFSEKFDQQCEAIHSEINKNTVENKQFSTDIIQSIDSILTTTHQNRAKIDGYVDEQIKSLVELSVEHQQILKEKLTNCLSLERKFFDGIKCEMINLKGRLDNYFTDADIAFNLLRDKTTENRDSGKSFMEQLTNSLESWIVDVRRIENNNCELKGIAEKNIEINKTIQDEFLTVVTKFQTLITESNDCNQTKINISNQSTEISKEKLLPSFEQQLQTGNQINDKREINFNEQMEVITDIENNYHTTIDLTSNYTHDLFNKLENNLEQNDAETIATKEMIENQSEELKTKINQFNSIHQQQMTNEQGTDQSIAAVIDKFSIENQRRKSNETQTLALLNLQVSNCQKYRDEVQRNIGIGKEMLVNFSQNELKTYEPTGETPAKKEFTYPRILAGTSPHDQIIKRFRNNYDAFKDCSITICEGDESTVSTDQDVSSIIKTKEDESTLSSDLSLISPIIKPNSSTPFLYRDAFSNISNIENVSNGTIKLSDVSVSSKLDSSDDKENDMRLSKICE